MQKRMPPVRIPDEAERAFRLKPNRRIPIEAEQGFQSKPNTHSDRSRTHIPIEAEHTFRSKPNRDSRGSCDYCTLSPEQASRLLSAAAGDDSPNRNPALYPFLCVALATRCRGHEVLAMRFQIARGRLLAVLDPREALRRLFLHVLHASQKVDQVFDIRALLVEIERVVPLGLRRSGGNFRELIKFDPVLAREKMRDRQFNICFGSRIAAHSNPCRWRA
jgi:hypothetical protein